MCIPLFVLCLVTFTIIVFEPHSHCPPLKAPASLVSPVTDKWGPGYAFKLKT